MKRIGPVASLACLVLTLSPGCSQRDDGRVRIVFAAGQDPSGATAALVEEFNRSHRDIRVEFQVMPPSSDTQHDAYVTYLSAGESGIDLYALDVIWTAEFAHADWIEPLPRSLIRTDEFLEGALGSAIHKERLYAVPWFTDAGVLYYRSDLLELADVPAPRTWEDLKAACLTIAASEGIDGFLWQGARYEGLVCNFLEFLWGAGGSLDPAALASDPDGVEENIASTLELMLELIEDERITPRSVLTYKEEESRRLFTEGRALFMRNWPYVWSLGQGAQSKVAGGIGIAPLPHAPGERSYSAIGGWNIALSRYSEHRDEAMEFLVFITGEHALKVRAIEGGYLPARLSTYQDEDVLRANPHFESFFDVFRSTKNRPASPYYPKVSDIIQEGVHAALSGDIVPERAARSMVAALSRILTVQ